MLYESEYYGTINLRNDTYIYHHGIKGQKWGVRRYQYTDGSLTDAGRRRYLSNSNNSKDLKNRLLSTYEKQKYKLTGNVGSKHVDTYIKANTPLYRIQTNDAFDKTYAFYSTYKNDDVKKYEGLFGRNLQSRAKHLGDNDAKVYQLQLKNKKRLRVPSEDSLAHITSNLLKDKQFVSDLKEAIVDSKSKMRRPSQQQAFNDALSSLKKDNTKLRYSDAMKIYRALNISLVNHNEAEKRMQNKFYDELKRNGYGALLDINDKTYSSYRAKSPIIVFSTEHVERIHSRQLDDIETKKLYRKYNTKRILSEIPNQIAGNMILFGKTKLSDLQNDKISKAYGS